MADRPLGHSAAARSLAQVNREPGRGTIFAVVTLLNAVVRPLTRRDWRAQDKIPQTGGVILVANHISNADPIALGQFVAFSGRWPRFLAKASLFRVPVVGPDPARLRPDPGAAPVGQVGRRACSPRWRRCTRAGRW